MKTRLLMLVVLITLVMFFVSQIDYSKTMNSSYFLLGEVEKQNMEEIISAVRYHTPSFSEVYNIINSIPYENSDGHNEIYVGNYTNKGAITVEPKYLTNNFIYTIRVDYNNTTKDIKVLGSQFRDTNPTFVEYEIRNEEGETKLVPLLHSNTEVFR